MDTIKEGKSAAQIIEDLIVNHTKEKYDLLGQLKLAQEQNAKLTVATTVLTRVLVVATIVITVNILEKKANKK